MSIGFRNPWEWTMLVGETEIYQTTVDETPTDCCSYSPSTDVNTPTYDSKGKLTLNAFSPVHPTATPISSTAGMQVHHIDKDEY
ncbi:MAG: hypothetical protein ACYC21_13800 [Eubacteriales bacterium]